MNTKLNQTPNWPDLAKQANGSVSGLAKCAGVSVRTLERHFLRQMGKRPKAWLIEQRQHRAVELLRHGNSVKEIAGNLGYVHASHFSREFKKYWACSPTAKTSLFGADNELVT